MALFTVVLLVRFLTVSGPIGYDQWAGILPQWMKF
jgi:succinate dehydrogenase / fumarate reductase membrane anchor subunit